MINLNTAANMLVCGCRFEHQSACSNEKTLFQYFLAILKRKVVVSGSWINDCIDVSMRIIRLEGVNLYNTYEADTLTEDTYEADTSQKVTRMFYCQLYHFSTLRHFVRMFKIYF